eukprot:gene716-63_t
MGGILSRFIKVRPQAVEMDLEEGGLQDEIFPWFHIIQWCAEERGANTVWRYDLDRIKARVCRLTSNEETFNRGCPVFDGMLHVGIDEETFFLEWALDLLEQVESLKWLRYHLVPRKILEDDFWSRYFSGVKRVTMSEFFIDPDAEEFTPPPQPAPPPQQPVAPPPHSSPPPGQASSPYVTNPFQNQIEPHRIGHAQVDEEMQRIASDFQDEIRPQKKIALSQFQKRENLKGMKPIRDLMGSDVFQHAKNSNADLREAQSLTTLPFSQWKDFASSRSDGFKCTMEYPGDASGYHHQQNAFTTSNARYGSFIYGFQPKTPPNVYNSSPLKVFSVNTNNCRS